MSTPKPNPNKQERNVLYPGTFDPITKGHESLILRATRLFDNVIVAIAASPKKTPVFTLDERIRLCNQCLGDHPNVKVIGFNTLLVDLAHSLNVKTVLRGLRAVSDFEYEFQLASMNKKIDPETGEMQLRYA